MLIYPVACVRLHRASPAAHTYFLYNFAAPKPCCKPPASIHDPRVSSCQYSEYAINYIIGAGDSGISFGFNVSQRVNVLMVLSSATMRRAVVCISLWVFRDTPPRKPTQIHPIARSIEGDSRILPCCRRRGQDSPMLLERSTHVLESSSHAG